ncbi:MAG: hypothetical protein IKW39_00795 [Alphaproteobacteria bacterium]|nr:hypothetical protein [Alphaproteobacteria bacterium]
METKEKKLAQVDELVTNLGLTRDEVVDYLTKLPPVEKKKISKIGTNIVKTTKSVTEEDIFNDIKNILLRDHDGWITEELFGARYLLSEHLGLEETDLNDLLCKLCKKYGISSTVITLQEFSSWRTVEDIVETFYNITNK